MGSISRFVQVTSRFAPVKSKFLRKMDFALLYNTYFYITFLDISKHPESEKRIKIRQVRPVVYRRGKS